MHEDVILMLELFVAVLANKIYRVWSCNSYMFTMGGSLHDVIRQNRRVLNGKQALVVDFCYAYLLLKNLDLHTKSRALF